MSVWSGSARSVDAVRQEVDGHVDRRREVTTRHVDRERSGETGAVGMT